MNGRPQRTLSPTWRWADDIPHRTEGEAVVLELLPPHVRRFLDLGTGDGRLLALTRLARPESDAVGLDFSRPMLEALNVRFVDDPKVSWSMLPLRLRSSMRTSIGRWA